MADETTRSPKSAPEYALHRVVKAAADVLPETNQANGMNMRGYERAHIQVVPVDGANPSVQVLWWSPQAAQFINDYTPITRAGQGVNTPYEFSVEARARVLFVAVTSGVAGGQTVRVLVAGSDIERD